MVLTRKKDGSEYHDTYYAYDDFGNLSYVLPPMIHLTSTPPANEGDENAALKQYGFLYKYDARNRCVKKRMPGCDWTFYVYDKADRLIYTQDGEQRRKTPQEWTFSIPDAFGRVVLTGICKDTISVSNKVVKGVFSATGAYKAYTIQVDGATKTFNNTLTNNPTILSVNYYDNYSFMGVTEVPNNTDTQYNPESGYNTRYTTSYQGMLTGTLTAQLMTDGSVSPTYLYSVMYYDSRGRLIQTKSNNHLSGTEKEYTAYNFTGQTTEEKHVHSVPGKSTYEETYSYTYDHALRRLKTGYEYNIITLAVNTYDDLGRLKTNQKYNNANLKTTYDYNVRSWITSISCPLFEEKSYYETPPTGMDAKGYYNGNLSSVSWKFSGESVPQGYNYFYDGQSRLTAAKFWRNSSYTLTDNRSMPFIAYDMNGNITNLQRYGNITSGTYGMIDNLAMTYNGNQVKAITDTNNPASISMDFKDYAKVAEEYTYNANGAMTKDLNKGINVIQYNSLNLPRQMDILSPVGEARNEYTYSASGEKLKVVQKSNPGYSTVPVIGTSINTSSLSKIETTDYVGNIIYVNNTLKRILIDDGYIENGSFYCYIKGHLGDNYIVANTSGAIVQKSQYYPFGANFADGVAPGTQPYKYNGKELDQSCGLNQYDYSARQYDPVIGRFTTIDPHAEKYPWISPYAFCLDNPLRFIDFDGKDHRDKLILNGKLEQVSQLATIAKNNGSQALSASISVEAAVYKTGVKFEAGPVSAEGNLKVGSVEAKASTDNVSVTGTALSSTLKVSSGNESVQANATIGTAQVSIDGNANIKTDASLGGASIGVNEGERGVSIDNNAKISLETQLGPVKAAFSVQLDKAVKWFSATVAAIGVTITPEIKKPEEVK